MSQWDLKQLDILACVRVCGHICSSPPATSAQRGGSKLFLMMPIVRASCRSDVDSPALGTCVASDLSQDGGLVCPQFQSSPWKAVRKPIDVPSTAPSPQIHFTET